MKRSYKFRLRPKQKDVQILEQTLRLHCELYNAALQERRDAWLISKVSINYGMQSAQLKDIRAGREDLSDLSFSSCQQTLRRLDRSFQAFYRRARSGQTPGFPRFKPQQRFNTIQYSKVGDGCAYNSETGRVYLKETGWLRVHQHRQIRGDIKTVSIKREGLSWFVIVQCDNVPVQALPVTGQAGGIDLGLRKLITTSDGDQYANPRHFRNEQERLAAAQQQVGRLKPGSGRQQKARNRVRSIHARIARTRQDQHHKLALDLLRRYDVVIAEELKTKNMSRSAAGSIEKPGKNVAAKRGLNKSILDAGWASFVSILTAKAESAGREIILINPAYTSQTCSKCKRVCKENRPVVNKFQCVSCGHLQDPDWNAAVNIKRAGLALQAESALAP